MFLRRVCAAAVGHAQVEAGRMGKFGQGWKCKRIAAVDAYTRKDGPLVGYEFRVQVLAFLPA